MSVDRQQFELAANLPFEPGYRLQPSPTGQQVTLMFRPVGHFTSPPAPEIDLAALLPSVEAKLQESGEFKEFSRLRQRLADARAEGDDHERALLRLELSRRDSLAGDAKPTELVRIERERAEITAQLDTVRQGIDILSTELGKHQAAAERVVGQVSQSVFRSALPSARTRDEILDAIAQAIDGLLSELAASSGQQDLQGAVELGELAYQRFVA